MVGTPSSWWCHFDDDNYVHVARLAQLLKAHDAAMPVYLGKPSTPKPMEIFDLKAPQVSHCRIIHLGMTKVRVVNRIITGNAVSLCGLVLVH